MFRWLIGKQIRDFCVVTAADRTHARSLFQFLGSVYRHAPGMPIIVYDLGLDEADWQSLQRDDRVDARTFPFERYPPFFDITREAGQYAWKPTIINLVMQERGGAICWMDAGNMLTAEFAKLQRQVERYAFYSPKSNGTVQTWTHPKTLAYLGMPADWGGKLRNLSGYCVAFDSDAPSVRAVIEEWARYAAIRDCIAPEGASRENHRQDQALLTVLAYRAGIARYQRKVGFTDHNDIG